MDLANITATIDKLATDFETTLTSHKGPKKVSTTVDYFREIVTPFVEQVMKQLEESNSSDVSQKETKAKAKAKTKTTRKKTSTKSSDDEKSTPRTWNQIFLIKEWGFKQRFPEDFERIEKELKQDANGKRITSLSVISKLRTELEEEKDQTRWLEYINWVKENLDSAPTESPKVKKTKTVKVSTSKKSKSVKIDKSSELKDSTDESSDDKGDDKGDDNGDY